MNQERDTDGAHGGVSRPRRLWGSLAAVAALAAGAVFGAWPVGAQQVPAEPPYPYTEIVWANPPPFGSDAVLTTTMTIGRAAGGAVGCDNANAALANCSTALASDSFSYAGVSYRITAMYRDSDSGSFIFRLDKDIPVPMLTGAIEFEAAPSDPNLPGIAFVPVLSFFQAIVQNPDDGPRHVFWDGRVVPGFLSSRQTVGFQLKVPPPWIGIETRQMWVQEGGTSCYGRSACYRMQIATQPTHDVTITLRKTGDNSITIDTDPTTTGNQTTITATPQNYRDPIVVVVDAAEDVDGSEGEALIRHTVTSTDPAYNGFALPNVELSEWENDTSYLDTLVCTNNPVLSNGNCTEAPLVDGNFSMNEGDTVWVATRISHLPLRRVAFDMTVSPATNPHEPLLPAASSEGAPEDYDRSTARLVHRSSHGNHQKTSAFALTARHDDDTGDELVQIRTSWAVPSAVPRWINSSSAYSANLLICDDDATGGTCGNRPAASPPALSPHALSAQPDRPPTITSITAQPNPAAPGGQVALTAVASDPDGDTLSYYWSAGGGSIVANGSAATWTAPADAGAYAITLGVSDGTGPPVTSSTYVTVQPATQRQTAAAPGAVDPDSIGIAHVGSELWVSWNAPDGATHYDVTYWAAGAAHARAAWNRAGTTLRITCDSRYPGQNRSCVDAGSSYGIGIRARNAHGNSEWVQSPTLAAPPPPVTVTLAAGPDWNSEGSVTEGGTATIRATRTGSTVAALSIPVRINPLNAEAGDWDAQDSYSIDFAAGQSQATLDIQTYADADSDDERFNVWMVRWALPAGVQAGSPHHVYVTIAEPQN